MMRIVAIAACGVGLAACSGVTGSISQFEVSTSNTPTMMKFESEPVGAEVRTSLGQLCRSPCSFAVAAEDFTVTFSMAGYQSQTVPVSMTVPDGASAGAPRLWPNPVFVELQVPPPPPPPPPKRKPVVAAKPNPKPPARAAVSRAEQPPPPVYAPAPPASSPWPAPPRVFPR
jgi:hypothetical protein